MRSSSVYAGRLAPRFRRVVALAVGLVLAGLACALADDLRTWTDVSGKHKMKAKFVSAAGGKVTLEGEDGAQFEIELAKLSQADQKHVADLQQAEKNPFKPVEASPFKSKKTSGRAKAAPADPDLAAPDWSSARVLALTPAQDKWEFPVAKAAAAPKLTNRAIPLPPKSNFFEGTKALVVSTPARRAVVGYLFGGQPGKGNEGATTRLVLCDLENGKQAATASVPGQFVPLALADDGARVLMKREEWGGGNQDRLELWNLSGADVEKVLRWAPYDDLKGGDRDVKWAAFLDAKRLATVSNNGKLVVWELDPLKPLYHLQAQGGATPAVSPDRKYLAFTTGNDVGVLDVAAGDVLALQAMPAANVPWPALSFSPGGTRLACVSMNKLFVWDFATGALYREIPLLQVPVQGPAVWTDEGHVLVGGFLIDLETQVKVWQYTGYEQVQPLGAVCYFVVSEGEAKPGALVPARLPQPGVQQALDKAKKDPNFFVLKPGVTVKIDVSGLADEDQREKVRKALAAKLEANGCQVSSNGTITLAASTELGKEREVTYRTIGRGFGVKTYKVKEHFTRVKFVYQGQTAWEARGGSVPHLAHLKQGQKMEDYLKEYEKPNYKYFETVELPKLLTRPTGRPALGTSTISTAGLR
jgi:SLA1 homology domain 1, SHD1